MSEEVVHVTRVPSGGWVVVSGGGTRSPLFQTREDALGHASKTAVSMSHVSGHPVSVRIQDARGKWEMHDESPGIAPS